MKVYTGGGDKGKTSLFSGERVPKHHLRIEAYGDLDELNSLLGVVASSLPEGEQTLHQDFDTIQAKLFVAGAWLATAHDSPSVSYLTPLPETVVKELEARIDALSETLPVLREFILPGGQPVAALSHMARTVCRRCERRLTELIENINGDTAELLHILVYVNRLSDYLFVLARYLNKQAGTAEKVWKK
ncbi:cob(I)yrinic acid a,c-diamide adenosyltransferase [Desulfobulbus oligotrophicus]|uniref:Corrinoid adenosyltransferase n=1 Tax=Desulfobulbus oligotrophicus TaxID=1909699 RepID=A0A7T6AQU2_9BACT|nr:cob(I)yrinic acid a,c-diamide adenosyltransferase [Desulfobulbus oligotrophicus]MDY0391315.1 cob(I)yrinic acid a,c-diamide adenosyltransferase [Desulfobulbus oligotrophicus]QQG66096.1 cob(I)yrinic acid a,c-diamide adenosyltransferase [Desulfobulbus oligotrophicus]